MKTELKIESCSRFPRLFMIKGFSNVVLLVGLTGIQVIIFSENENFPVGFSIIDKYTDADLVELPAGSKVTLIQE